MPIRKQLLLTCSENKGGKCEEKRKKKEEESGATWKNKTRKKAKFGGRQCLENVLLACSFLDWKLNQMTEI